MAELKTKRTGASVDAFIEGIVDEDRRRDCRTLVEMMRRVSGAEPEIWSSGLVGFGTYHYKYASGREADWFPLGFASRKTNLTVYLTSGVEPLASILARLGKYTTGKGCLYVKRLSDVDLEVLEELLSASLAQTRRMNSAG